MAASELTTRLTDQIMSDMDSDLTEVDTKSASISFDSDWRKLAIDLAKMSTDFEFRFATNEEPIKVNKHFLLLKNCHKLLNQSDNHIVVNDCKRDDLKAIIDWLYSGNDKLDIDDNNIDSMIKVSIILGHDSMYEKLDLRKQRLKIVDDMNEFMKLSEKINSFVTKRSKRKESFNESSIKRFAADNSDQPFLKSDQNDVSLDDLDNKSIDELVDNAIDEDIINRSNISMDQLVTNHSICKLNSSTQSVGSVADDSPEVTSYQNSKSIKTYSSIIKPRISSLKPRISSLKPTISSTKSVNKTVDYTIDKYLTHSKTNVDTNVWNSCFVPNNSENDRHVIAVVGGKCINWYDLDDSYKPLGTFEAPNNNNLRCVAYTQFIVENNKFINVCVIGSEWFIYFCKEPEDQQLVTTYDSLNVDAEEVTAIVFNPKKPNYLMCGTSDHKVIVWKLVFNLDGTLVKSQSSIVLRFTTRFTIISLVYIDKYDCLIVSGESNELLFIADISKEKPYQGSLTLGRKVNCVSSMIYIPDNSMIVFRSVSLDCLQTICNLDQMMSTLKQLKKQAENKSSKTNQIYQLSYKMGPTLKHSKCPNESAIEFISMTYNCGLIACGDYSGKIFVYKVIDLKVRNCVEPVLILGEDITWTKNPTIIRSVCMSDDNKFIISTTNTNMVCIWKS